MPELYGQPFKDELRAEIRELKRALSNEKTAHRNTRRRLEFAYARIEALEERDKKMEQLAQEIIAIATQEIEFSDLQERVRQAGKRRMDESYAKFVASNAA